MARHPGRYGRPPGSPPAPCRHELGVVEPAWCGNPDKHVRGCDHPLNDDGRCTRGPNNGSVWSCRGCEHREVREA